MRKRCKKNLCFRRKSQQPFEFLSSKLPKEGYTPALKRRIEMEYGDDLEAIYNEQYLKK